MRALWCRLSLTQQFGLLATLLIGVVMATVGTWVTGEIQHRVLQQIASSRAIVLDRFVSPFRHELGSESDLSPESQQAIAKLLTEVSFGLQVLSIKIWAPGGRIVYSTNASIIGKSFPPRERLIKAFAGQVTVQLEQPDDDEHEFEHAAGRPLVEIYAPIIEHGTGKVIAVAELYELADQVTDDIRKVGRETWLIVGLITLGMIVALFSIVRRGSETISQQRTQLADRVERLTRVLQENRNLQHHIQIANVKAANGHELVLRRISADLHDGPAQLISLALLLLDRLKASRSSQDDGEYCRVRDALADALQELRAISAGLTPPQLEDLTPAAAIELAVQSHERRTGTPVQCDVGSFPTRLSPLLKTCLYRLVQEGLNNAFRHARGSGQVVNAWSELDTIIVEVKDSGPGILQANGSATNTLGLAGLRNRIESLGGDFELQSRPGAGTRLAARFNIATTEVGHG